ncbi:threonine aldolase family protein [Aureivirga sp. CE67]|uniref:threonine aldolase family protein n=1 Tax=Aureivirga sp. CE67 TaxID=1788983 RepID=UPI0018CB485A|nr:aminotransferase class I/II-fold pyridoxal phosphate-dependent enzyme [Aureivirga sp. CE67]
MEKYSFLNDYSEGAHPAILKALSESNFQQMEGYGNDVIAEETKTILHQKMNQNSSEIFFVSGGTQANLIIISSALRPHESVISVDTGHITLREAGAIEATGHKINVVESTNGKITKELILPVLKEHDFGPHVVKPKMIYISNSTEVGTIYTKKELEELYAFAKENKMYLFLDGARLGAALTASDNDLTLEDVAKNTDVFTIGGTKNGALLGEVIVVNNEKLQEDFPFHIKQKGAMLSKGRLLSTQFRELFKDDLYFTLAKHANKMAEKLTKAILDQGYKMLADSTTNQIFPILPKELIQKLEKDFIFYRWKEIDENNIALRIVTSWATKEEKVEEFIEKLKP